MLCAARQSMLNSGHHPPCVTTMHYTCMHVLHHPGPGSYPWHHLDHEHPAAWLMVWSLDTRPLPPRELPHP
jgi:hypothetical protein